MNDDSYFDPEPAAEPPMEQPRAVSAPPVHNSRSGAPITPKPEKPKLSVQEPSGNARPLPAEEQQEIAQLLESLGGPTAGRVKLSLRRHEKGRGWRSLPPLEIEPWQFTDGGFDLEETVGQQYGDGRFAWILRYRGRFLRRGDLNVVGYGEVDLDEIETTDAPAPVDLSDVVSRLKTEILGELKPLVQNREGDNTRMLHETMLRLIETKLNREPVQAPRPQGPDPIVASLITAMSAQTTSFMQLMAQQGSAKTDAGSLLRDSMGAMRELIETTRSMVVPVQQPNPVYEYELEDEEEPETESPVTPAAPQASLTESLISDFGEMFRGTAKRMMGTALAASEEKVTSKIADSPTVGNPAEPAIAPPQPATPVPPAASPSQGATIIAIIDAVDQCIARKLPAERLAAGLIEDLPRPLIENFATITPVVLSEMVKQMGHPEAALRFQRPEYSTFLTEVIALLRQKIGLPPAPSPSTPAVAQS